MYLIETSTCVSMLRGRHPHVVARVRQTQADDLRVSSITAAELYYGAARGAHSEQEVRRIRSFLSVVAVLDFGSDAAISYGIVRALLERSGRPIGPLDMLIAGHALAVNATLVTHNTGEFQRVPGLAVEDWAS